MNGGTHDLPQDVPCIVVRHVSQSTFFLNIGEQFLATPTWASLRIHRPHVHIDRCVCIYIYMRGSDCEVPTHKPQTLIVCFRTLTVPFGLESRGIVADAKSLLLVSIWRDHKNVRNYFCSLLWKSFK